MKTFTLAIDARMEETLTSLQRGTGKSSKADVLRAAVATYALIADIIKRGDAIAATDKHGRKVRGLIFLPELEALRPARALTAVSSPEPDEGDHLEGSDEDGEDSSSLKAVR